MSWQPAAASAATTSVVKRQRDERAVRVMANPGFVGPVRLNVSGDRSSRSYAPGAPGHTLLGTNPGTGGEHPCVCGDAVG